MAQTEHRGNATCEYPLRHKIDFIMSTGDVVPLCSVYAISIIVIQMLIWIIIVGIGIRRIAIAIAIIEMSCILLICVTKDKQVLSGYFETRNCRNWVDCIGKDWYCGKDWMVHRIVHIADLCVQKTNKCFQVILKHETVVISHILRVLLLLFSRHCANQQPLATVCFIVILYINDTWKKKRVPNLLRSCEGWNYNTNKGTGLIREG